MAQKNSMPKKEGPIAKAGDFFGGVGRYDSKTQAVGTPADQRTRKAKNTPAMKEEKVKATPKKVARY